MAVKIENETFVMEVQYSNGKVWQDNVGFRSRSQCVATRTDAGDPYEA